MLVMEAKPTLRPVAGDPTFLEADQRIAARMEQRLEKSIIICSEAPMIIMDALELTRRKFFQAAIADAVLTSASAAQRLVPTDPDVEGPFYKEGAPFREEIFAPGKRGTRLEISGRVLSTKGEAIRGALLDLWNANPQGIYDLQGFEFRGKVKTD